MASSSEGATQVAQASLSAKGHQPLAYLTAQELSSPVFYRPKALPLAEEEGSAAGAAHLPLTLVLHLRSPRCWGRHWAALGGTQVAVALEHLADIPAVPDGRGGHQNGCLLRRTTLPGQHAHQSWALAG